MSDEAGKMVKGQIYFVVKAIGSDLYLTEENTLGGAIDAEAQRIAHNAFERRKSAERKFKDLRFEVARWECVESLNPNPGSR